VLEAAQQTAGTSNSQASAEERRPDPSSTTRAEQPEGAHVEDEAPIEAGIVDIASILRHPDCDCCPVNLISVANLPSNYVDQ
jgi:hypothetical protein